MKKNLGVFFSGFGSNLEVFLQNKEAFHKIIGVCSNPKAHGLHRLKKHGVPGLLLDKPIDWQDLHRQLVAEKIDLLFLAGFMKILPESFVSLWENKIYNLHPSLLPKYKGLKSIQRAYEAGDSIGVTIHQVTPELDAGPIVDQQVAVTKEELSSLNLDQVEKKVHSCEHLMVKAWLDQIS